MQRSWPCPLTVFNYSVATIKGNIAFPKKEQAAIQNCFYISKDSNWQFDSIKQLSSTRLGVLNHYSYGDAIDEYVDKLRNTSKVVIISGTHGLQERLLDMLLLNRVEAILESRAVMDYFIKQTKQTKLVKIAGCLDKPEKAYIAFSPMNFNSNHYAQILSDSVQELRASGKLQLILDNYGVQDWQ